jgi:RNA polymerase sigma-70 factor, ECF subfamily
MPPSSDAQLLTGLAAGEEAAYSALYDEYGAALFRTARAILGSSAEAEDAVQDVFVSLVRAGDRLRAVQNLKAYLYASLRRAAVRRMAGRRPPVVVRPATDSAPGPDAEISARLEQALVILTDEQKVVVALHIDAGLTFAECAEALGENSNTVASRYRYAIERLRAVLKE